ncbi:hypothetical protein IPZ58_06340 [Streptomyces roseoverticillatus]|uniref:DUF6542 domain-containing protein n=1 Tax=Streptomyces roseoverticillatus TaxID=66429 RepID=UPI001F3AB512|nr:DUF6542 domain-containing protein [Streptomyces roseoverticillatus]MCF3101199.1 hypothetical protein [Streptomyces roseoverticillatus]
MGRRRTEAPGKARQRARRARAAVSAPAALLVAGAGVDEAAGAGLGLIFVLTAAAAAALAAVLCPRGRTWWVLAAPPLVIAVVAVGAQLAAGADRSGGSLVMAVVHWALDTFPAMAAAEATAAVVLAGRALRPGRGRRACHA